MAVNVSFGGCGFLLAFHIGVAKYLRQRGLLSATSRYAGASGGALVAASLAYDIPMSSVLEETKFTAHGIHQDIKTYRKFNLSKYVDHHIDTLFEEDLPFHDRLVITTTELWPRPRIVYWKEFKSKKELSNCLLLSCHVPWYFNGEFACRLHDGRWHADGGLMCFVPHVDDHIKVDAFPSWKKSNTISPSLIQNFPISTLQLAKWAFLPPSNDIIDQIVQWGQDAAREWVTASMMPPLSQYE